MLQNLRLFHKFLIPVAVLLSFETVFVFTVNGMFQDLQRTAVMEHEIGEAIDSLNDLYIRISQIARLVTAQALGKISDGAVIEYRQTKQIIPQDLRNVSDNFREDHGAQPLIEKISENTASSLRIIDESFESGDRTSLLRKLRQLKSRVPALLDQLLELRAHASELKQDRLFHLQRQQKQLSNALVAATGANVLLALALLLYFHRNITGRLGVVMQNLTRIVRKEPLVAVIGSDEIGQLDRSLREMATALEVAHRKEHAIVETIPAALMIVDDAGLIRMCNPAVRDLFFYDQDTLLQKPVKSLFQGTSETDFDKLVLAAKQRPQQTVVHTKSETSVDVELSTTTFVAFDSEYQLFVMLDISERKRIERLKQEFVSMVSHDLRTPLTSIQIFLSMVAKGMITDVDSIRSKSATADRNATRLIGLINDLLDVEKMESGDFSLDLAPTSIVSVVERAVESVRVFGEKSSVAIDTLAVGDASLTADGDRLVQVLVNLLGNAIKFSPDGGTVKIATEIGNSVVKVKVIDQGRGVPEHKRDDIFERFKQVEAKDASEKKGAGLGLSILKQIVSKHGGACGVESQNEKGSVFWFSLPLVLTTSGNLSEQSNDITATLSIGG